MAALWIGSAVCERDFVRALCMFYIGVFPIRDEQFDYCQAAASNLTNPASLNTHEELSSCFPVIGCSRRLICGLMTY